MSESKKLNHNPETLSVFKELRKVDQFMFGGENIKSALDQAFETGAIGFFALDCVVSEPIATEEGIGKIPLVDPAEIKKFSGLLWQKEPIEHIARTLNSILNVNWLAFLGDDDFAHSVSKPWSLDDDRVFMAISSQMETLKESFDRFKLQGWHCKEQSDPKIQDDRSAIVVSLTEGLQAGSLPPAISKRLGQMKAWRTNIVKASGLSPVEMEALISTQAVEEMASFMVQGLRAVAVI